MRVMMLGTFMLNIFMAGATKIFNKPDLSNISEDDLNLVYTSDIRSSIEENLFFLTEFKGLVAKRLDAIRVINAVTIEETLLAPGIYFFPADTSAPKAADLVRLGF